ncbi:hypothetical protein RRG08_064584 [Elysia crispata]|uniref:Uncharacterized protein n=1 Tax=Elysia crispata TaxID=231223 RepID=A0AAE1ECT9_9GAST|nr:hypothetical protein RRG08_064584 [Elysia crispata]
MIFPRKKSQSGAETGFALRVFRHVFSRLRKSSRSQPAIGVKQTQKNRDTAFITALPLILITCDKGSRSLGSDIKRNTAVERQDTAASEIAMKGGKGVGPSLLRNPTFNLYPTSMDNVSPPFLVICTNYHHSTTDGSSSKQSPDTYPFYTSQWKRRQLD